MSAENYLSHMFGLNGKTALVIGGTGVLGGGISETLAKAGAHVVIIGRNEANGQEQVQKIKTTGGSAELFLGDSADKDCIPGALALIAKNGQQPDILVNSAGTNSATPFFEISDDEWDRIFSVNVKIVRQSCQIVGKAMIDQQIKGSIINVASLSAITPLSRVFTYSASKAAVLNLTLNLAREWAPNNIRVNALSPGFFPAEQNRKVLTPDRVAKIMSHTPMNRFGNPEELSGAVLLMASNNAGSFMTGHNIVVDGGFSAMTI
jgi:NAD(P)-dependent dehydrogenase (short-subunit alcohol dehydrogenase family)